MLITEKKKKEEKKETTKQRYYTEHRTERSEESATLISAVQTSQRLTPARGPSLVYFPALTFAKRVVRRAGSDLDK